MIRRFMRRIYSQHYEIDISQQHDRARSTVKHYSTQNGKNIPPVQSVTYIHSLRNSNETRNNAPMKEELDDNNSFLQHLVKYVEKTTYMEDVRTAQAKVMDIKKKLLSAGDEKRSVMRNLEDLRNDLNHIYKDMKINRSKETYLDLARKEIELCEMEKNYSDTYKRLDKDEQYLFVEFSTAINESYEKEKLHTNFIKVISIIGTVTSSFMALILSLLYHAFRYNKDKKINSMDEDVLKSIKVRLGSIEKAVSEINKPGESWGSYLHRKTRWVYSWAVKT